MNRSVRPEGVGPPSANYELAVLSTTSPDQSARQLFTSGIGPTRPDGSVPDAVEVQAEVIWATLTALLREADMSVADVVQVTTYVVVPGDSSSADGVDDEADDEVAAPDSLQTRLSAAMAARDAALGSHRCASVLVPVPALATDSWKMEVALVAIS